MEDKMTITEGDILTEQFLGRMEYLMGLLRKEWEKSGETYRVERIPADRADEAYRTLKNEMIGRVKNVDVERLPFEAAVAYTAECFVFLRLIKKTMSVMEKVTGNEMLLDVALDKEEWLLYCEYLR